MRSPKILIAAGNGHRTEAEMIIGLHDHGIDIQAAFNPGSAQIDRLMNAGVPTRELNLKSNIDFRNISRIRRWIKDEGFDIVHGLANRQVANFISASYGLPNKVIAYRGAIGHVSRWDPTCYIKWLNPRIDRIICVSKAVERDLAASGIASDKLITIYKGHDLAWYEGLDGAAARRQVNEEFGIPAQATLVGMAANMRPVKGADLLLRAMMDLPAHIHGLFIGEVRDDHIHTLARDPRLAGRVHFTGFRQNAAAVIGALDINTAPSRGREGLTKTVIEGMAQGIPTVVTTAGGLPELIENQSCGYVIAIDDAAALTEKINHLAKDPELRRTYGARARNRVVTKFGVEQTIEKTAALYRELLAGK